ncbi:MAG TPA: YihY/virulence factor BrkB family protein [Romboutsia timonensis]|uniref:YihY/virulence factor BrkB family protein n=1 Tax=Romboutsia timonensis TaxID=1776391 RepID=A0A921N1G9_9FIRM|nr:YihY/virulence factor BrkB family protein [uncultured Romboutsia sp.]HJG97233.1 YihY/virulence factor BrkB family protein [Romboutsia timonensis]
MKKLNVEYIRYFFRKFNYSEINSKAAEMSFYLLLSIFPFLIFTISIIVYIPTFHLNKSILIIKNVIPESAFNIILSIINSAIENKSLGFLILSFIFTLWTSSRGIRSLIRWMNKSYKVQETRSFFKVCIISFIFTVSILVLIFSSIILLIYGELIGYFIFNLIGLNSIFIYIWNILRYIVGVSTLIIILINLYKYTPNKNIKIKDVIPGAIIATLVWLIISFFYSYYTNNYSNYEVIYGSIGGIIVLMTWLYLSSWSILIGLEVNVRLYFRKLKSREKSV